MAHKHNGMGSRGVSNGFWSKACRFVSSCREVGVCPVRRRHSTGGSCTEQSASVVGVQDIHQTVLPIRP